MTADVRSLAEVAARECGLVVLDATVNAFGRRSVVRVVIDRQPALDERGWATEPTPSVTLDEVASVTRLLSPLLDEGDVLGESPYTLEVTSPGIDRPVTVPHGLARSVGRMVRITRTSGDAVEGRIASVGPESVALEVITVPGGPTTTDAVTLADIAKAVIQVEFSRETREGE